MANEKLVKLVTAALCNQSVEEVVAYLIANGVDIPVRCKDCKCNDACSIQDAMNWSRNKEVDDYFCSYGERR